MAKTDHTLWFKRNEWPEHLAGSNLRHLSLASRLPSKEERVLQQAVEINKTLIESCVEGLRTLDREVRRWLRSAELSEPDVRPLARLQNPESQRTYVAYMSRLLCYSLRLLQSQQAQEIRHEDSVSSASADSSDDDSSSDDGTVGRQHSRSPISLAGRHQHLQRRPAAVSVAWAATTAARAGAGDHHTRLGRWITARGIAAVVRVDHLSEGGRRDIQERRAALSRRARDQRRRVPAPTGE